MFTALKWPQEVHVLTCIKNADVDAYTDTVSYYSLLVMA